MPGARSPLAQLSDEERQSLIARLLKNRQAHKPEITAQPRTTTQFPVSFAQQRIWLLQQLFPQTTGFNVVQALRLRGVLDRAALEQSLDDVTRRHEALRTTFEMQDGSPVQRILPTFALVPTFDDLRDLPGSMQVVELTRRARDVASCPWDLSAGPPLRSWLWQLADDEHALMIAMHHILCDGWSLNLVMRDLFACYQARSRGAAPSLPVAPLQYGDYAVWQREWLHTDSFQTQLAAWERRMADATILRLPSHRADAETAAALARRVVLPPDLTRRLKTLSQDAGVTPFMTLLAAFSIVLSAYSDQDDIVVGSPVASRTRAEFENVVGCFMNPLPFRVALKGNPTFRQLLARVREMALEVYASQDVPFDLIVRALRPKRDIGNPPLYQVMFLLHNQPRESRELAPSSNGAALEAKIWPLLASGLWGDDETRLATDRIFPAALELYEWADSLVGFVEYAPEYSRVLSQFPFDFGSVLEAAVAEPESPLNQLPVLSIAAQRRARASSIALSSVPAGDMPDVSAAFDQQAQLTPDAIAVVDREQPFTYCELAARVSRLAAHLQAVPAVPGTAIGVLLDRSVDAVVALLAILRAGCAYVPLDPALPTGRLALMLEHVRMPVVLTREEVLARAEIDRRLLEGQRVICLDVEAESIDRQSERPPVAVHPEHLAYVLYTSGSSGRPKAVAIPRGALSNYAQVARTAFGIDTTDRVLQFASLNFDTAAEEIFPTLLAGATLVLRNETMLSSVPAFFAACADWGITVIDLPTAYWHELTAHLSRSSLRVPESLRLVILGGEKALAGRVREWLSSVGRRVRLFNTYGPTETTVVATMCDLTDLQPVPEQVPLGRAIPNAYACVLNRGLDPAPGGATAELCIGGAGLARGYLNDPALTAEKFVPDAVSGRSGARLYRTGDLAKLGADGTLEFAGRVDDQVKLRGHRIEPGEIESVLALHPSIREAAVIAREDHPGDLRLVAYLVPFESPAPSIGDVRGFLHDRLPDYMVPSAFVLLDTLPRTIQRKVDRAALPAPTEPAPDADDRFVAPQTEVEQKIASIWSEVLHRDRIGIVENFFDLGGHSLLVVQLHARLCEAFGSDLALVDLFRLPTVESQAAHLTERGTAPVFDEVTDRATRQRHAFRRHGQTRSPSSLVAE